MKTRLSTQFIEKVYDLRFHSFYLQLKILVHKEQRGAGRSRSDIDTRARGATGHRRYVIASKNKEGRIDPAPILIFEQEVLLALAAIEFQLIVNILLGTKRADRSRSDTDIRARGVTGPRRYEQRGARITCSNNSRVVPGIPAEQLLDPRSYGRRGAGRSRSDIAIRARGATGPRRYEQRGRVDPAPIWKLEQEVILALAAIEKEFLLELPVVITPESCLVFQQNMLLTLAAM
ncbi:hypothetical protein CEXT_491251 [Caerostris extrusa]|uniref:Uncharacterized protein n=1 Tax=Caerostris extrusa TaxID=172846 RepID=A0AAV4UGD5_CAEEX|nr:hypothetical protein CEXT_491251 [Caerostris extrusa]